MSPKSYLVTGANRGLGLEFVRQISSNSSTKDEIFACVRSKKGELDDLRQLASNNPQIHIIECDTSSVESIQRGASQVINVLGSAKLDYLINNAGINSVPHRTALDFTGDELRQHIDINVIGPAEMVKALDEQIGEGSVVLNVTSGLGSCGKGISRCTAYAISKAALNMLMLHQAEALRDRGASAIVVDPGWVKTRMGGEEALITPDESIRGMLKILHSVTVEKSGTFFQYDGETVPW